MTVMVWYNAGATPGVNDIGVRFWSGANYGFDFWPGGLPEAPAPGHFGAAVR